MNSEQLQSLVVDRELGELSPQAAALLEAYLARDPSAAELASSYAATVQLARRALPVAPASPVPPIALGHRLRRTRIRRLAARKALVGQLAACLAAGLALGWLAHSARERSDGGTAGARAVAALARPPAEAAPADPSSRFWTVAYLTRR